MDIRSFFGPTVGTKKQKDEKPAAKTSKQPSRNESKSRGRKQSGHRDSSTNQDRRTSARKKNKNMVSDDEPEADVVVTKIEKKKKRHQRVIDSDSDEEPVSVKSKKKKKDVAVLVSDSEEDESKTKKRSSLESFVKITPPKPKTKAKEKSPEKKTSVSVADFFGSGCVKRIDKKVVVGKRKLSSEEIEIHDDDDFTKTLSQLDQQSKKKAKIDDSPEKPIDKPSLSSKLAGKMKYLVEDTPEKQDKSDVKKLSPLKRRSPRKTPIKHEVTFTPHKKSPSTKSPADLDTPVQKKPSPKKTSPNESGTPSLERRTSYRSYLTREGPRALGSKELPQGADNCLEDLTFVITGVLESLERDEAKSFVEKHGGKVTTSLSKKTNYLVVGRDAGESKLAKATQFKTKQIDEDGLIELVKTLPGKKSKYVIKAEQEMKESSNVKNTKMTTLKKKLSDSFSHAKETDLNSNSIKSSKSGTDMKSPDSERTVQSKSPVKSGDESGDSLLWVDKYKPANTNKIIGQQGDKSNAKKLLHWLKCWHKNRAAGTKPAGRFFGGGGKDDGGGYKAALLSGPPGIGKTTTATLVCQEAGFSYVELNASDTRSKRNLQEVVAESLNNTTLVDFMGGGESGRDGRHHCIIMDEVDGMAGNEDRGGLQELVSLIKSSRIPIICICNDRNSMKMRTLSNHCFDLRFSKPRVEQIKGAMMSLAYKEGLTISPPALNEIILAANHDIRQIIHNMSVWSATNKRLTYEQAKSDSAKAQKDTKMGPFDVCRKVFASDESSKMTLNDKSDLFFHDYSIAPLFVQENYIYVNPFAARGNTSKHLSLLARTAESICDGDLADRLIRSASNWNLLPTQAMFASVIPGQYMCGGISQMVQFPSWLGKNSTRTKNDRILQELRGHMCLKISGNKTSLNQDYLPAMRYTLTYPLVQHGADGVKDVIDLMDNYDIMKDDFDNIMEVSRFPNSEDPLGRLDTKTKAAFTRTYNKEVHLMPYSSGMVAKKKQGKSAAAAEADVDMEDGGDPTLAVESDDDEDDNVELDTMIKTKKKPTGKGKEVVLPQSKSRKGQGKGKGKGKGKS
ncbi:replication factor C subunit 1-like isoform X2 [Gigantopelta aegis]|uniref:replication factor C subunit 1-like isoform X2 n=1 Tax=Gigantopelta aegis TaxID=1735272 RepID=UPI001B88DE5D|nr:replication factor C subunit 1-like isoform X2 [Gigantopelta aegis]